MEEMKIGVKLRNSKVKLAKLNVEIEACNLWHALVQIESHTNDSIEKLSILTSRMTEAIFI